MSNGYYAEESTLSLDLQMNKCIYRITVNKCKDSKDFMITAKALHLPIQPLASEFIRKLTVTSILFASGQQKFQEAELSVHF